jgi:hypothetical protein
VNALKNVKPSPSYCVSVPDEVREEYDDRVSSFWSDGKPLLLQLSSYLRAEGEQIAAHNRLQQRIERHPGNWRIWSQKFHPDSSIDQATAELVDENKVLWIHSYLVWPHLTVYALVSGPESEAHDPANWACRAVKSIKLALQ